MRNLRSYDANTPELSIVILNFNKAFLTVQCLASIWYHTDSCKYEIVVVDNGSEPEDVAMLEAVEGPFRLLRLRRNHFFGEGNNIGVEAARGRFLALLNNDVIVTAGWLSPLLKALNEYPACGAAVPKFIYPDGRLLEAGAVMRIDGSPEQRGQFGRPDEPEFNRGRPVDYGSAAGLLLRKETFEQAQGFDLCWEPGYYEDADLCFKMAGLDLKTYYVPESTIVHCENATSGDPRYGIALHDIITGNQQKFVGRWRRYLLERNAQAARLCVKIPKPKPVVADYSPKARVALFVPGCFLPGEDERYLLNIAECLVDEYEVWLVTGDKCSRIRLETIARLFGLDVGNVRLAFYEDVDIVFDLWVAMGRQIVPPIDGRGTHNIFLFQLPPKPESGTVDVANRWSRYKCVVACSRYVVSQAGNAAKRWSIQLPPVEVIYPPVGSVAQPDLREKKHFSIVNVGRFCSGARSKRQDLLIEAFRWVVADHPALSLELHLAGFLRSKPEDLAYFRSCQELAQNLPIHFHLDASTEELASLYQSSVMYWHAAGMGGDPGVGPDGAEAFGISIAEAMAHGCIPVVFARGGPPEIVEDGISGLHFRNLDGLISATTRIFSETDETCISRMRRAAVSRSASFSRTIFAANWKQLVQTTLENDCMLPIGELR
jgi:GT2 family glycosyltransferase